MIEFTIYSKILGGKNNMMVSRSGHHYPNKRWAEWRDRVVQDLKEVLNPKMIEVPCIMEVQYWNGDKRRRDIPAMVDSLYHCFERAGLIADDGLVRELHWLPMGYDKLNPRVVVKLKEI